MSTDKPNTGDILRSLHLLRSPDAADRKQGIQILSGLTSDQRVLQVFEYLYQIDPDPDVRQMAWQAITWQGPSVPAPGPEQAARGASSSAAADQRRLFLMNPANAKLVADLSRKEAAAQHRGRIASALATILLFVAGIFWGLVLPDWITWYKFREEGVSTQGNVISLEARETAADETQYVVFYHFATGQAEEELTYSGEQQVSWDFYDSLLEDTPVDVTYLPDDPNQSQLDDAANPQHEQRNDFTVVAAGLTAIIVLLFVLSALQRRQPARARDKHLLRGQVVSSSGHWDDDGDFNIKLRYSFQLPSGRTIIDQRSHIRNDLNKTSLPDPGTPVAVYYQNEHSYRLL